MESTEGLEEAKRFPEFIGIKGYEEKAYLTLLRLGEATAPVIAAKASLPLPRVYDVLNSLLRKGLVEVKAGRPRSYRALPPSIALKTYVRNFVENLNSRMERALRMLESIYAVKNMSHEPYIWLSHSVEASIDKARSWLMEMSVDGYACLDKQLTTAILPLLSKKLQKNRGLSFTLTLLEEPDKGLIMKLDGLDNLMILYQPTGYIRMLEMDFRRGVLFGETYSLFTAENELLALFNDTYFYGYWRNAQVLKDFRIKRGDLFVLRHHWLALHLSSLALSEGYKIKANVTGRSIRDRKDVRLEGMIVKTYRSVDDKTRTLILLTRDGREVTTGGRGASVEDVSAELIELKIM